MAISEREGERGGPYSADETQEFPLKVNFGSRPTDATKAAASQALKIIATDRLPRECEFSLET
jgi:hypothetical protein